MIVVFTRAAERDVEAIGDYIVESSPRRAATFVAALIERCNLIADHPFAFSLVPRFGSKGIPTAPLFKVPDLLSDLLRAGRDPPHYSFGP